MTLARSCGLLRPAKVILVPGANSSGWAATARACPNSNCRPRLESASEKAKPPALADRLTEHAPQIRAERVGAALVGVVAGGAFLEDLLALGRVGLGKVEFDRLLGRRAPPSPSWTTPSIG